MTKVGIEALNVFAGDVCLDVRKLAEHRGLEMARFDNLLMKQKSVAMPYEDPVTFGVNAAKPIVDALSDEQRARIELVISCTESGLDFGKSISTYIHHYLGLSRNCRLLELKQACYSGTAGMQMAANFVLSGTSPGAKALVIATDISRYIVAKGSSALTADWSFAEPSGGAGAVALLVSDAPRVFELDVGASGYYGYEVMDTCRPMPDGEAGDAELSLLSYLDCCEQAFAEYQKRIDGVSYRDSFGHLIFHAPFGGMVKGAHRSMLRKLCRATPPEIDDDFRRRVAPGLEYCCRVGNIMGASLFLSLASLVDNAPFEFPSRVGCFSYGSGCCSEFFSGVVRPEAKHAMRPFALAGHLEHRYQLQMDEYETLIRDGSSVRFGTRNTKPDHALLPTVRQSLEGSGRLYLDEVREFHRRYAWA